MFSSFALKRFLWLGSGVLAGIMAAWGLSIGFTYTQAPSYDRGKISRYELYSPFLRKVRKHIVIGSCEVSLPMLANNVSDPTLAPRGGGEAWLGNVVNYVLRNELGDVEDEFFDISAPNSNLGHHATYLYHALKAENLASVIYVNGLGLTHNISPGDALEVMAVVESFERDFPEAAPEIKNYKRLFQETAYFHEGEEKYGKDWRMLIDPQSLTLSVATPDTLNATFVMPPKEGIRARAQFYGTWFKERINALTGGPAYAARWLADGLFGFTALQRDESIRRSYDWAITQNSPATIRFMRLQENNYLDGEESDLQRAWFKMMAAVVRAKGARLVIYAQPMLTIPPGDHRDKFRPRYIDRLAGWLAPYDPIFVDHTVDHDLAQDDFVFECEEGQCTSDTLFSSGYWANLPGRMKQARLLAAAMSGNGLLATRSAAPTPPKRRAGCVTYKDSPDSCYQW